MCCCYGWISKCDASISPSNIDGQLLDILVTNFYPTFPLNGLILFHFLEKINSIGQVISVSARNEPNCYTSEKSNLFKANESFWILLPIVTSSNVSTFKLKTLSNFYRKVLSQWFIKIGLLISLVLVVLKIFTLDVQVAWLF